MTPNALSLLGIALLHLTYKNNLCFGFDIMRHSTKHPKSLDMV